MSVTLTDANERPMLPAAMHGLAGKCPACGKARLFKGFLKTVDRCDACGAPMHHHRADDLPPYLAILVVGHLLIGVMIHLDMVWHIAPMTYLMIMVPLGIVLPLALLQPLKGMVVGMQWAKRMHGFGSGRDAASPEEQ
ncbi:MAG: DUF983 domain-containing protein [Alphaproteobacteria bacterium]|nr:DUF983 domain-containing protein [Alphaproteobacteria bacterium]